jgi:putative transposase
MQNHDRIPRLRGFDYSRARTYFVTLCVQDRQRIFSDHKIAALAQGELKSFRARGWYWLYAFVVMPDHIHLLLRLRDESRKLGRIVATLKSAIQFGSRQAGTDLNWQYNFFDHVVRLDEPLDNIVGYILRNPERAGLVTQGELYPFAAMVDQYR